MNISIGNDHAGTAYKRELLSYLTSKGHTVINHGTNDDNSMDYPDTIHPVAEDVANHKSDIGIIICGSGNGANMTANKHKRSTISFASSSEINRAGKLRIFASLC
jgi:ribose 5-phosphate isomerase B